MTDDYYEWGTLTVRLDNGRVITLPVLSCKRCAALIPADVGGQQLHNRWHDASTIF